MAVNIRLYSPGKANIMPCVLSIQSGHLENPASFVVIDCYIIECGLKGDLV